MEKVRFNDVKITGGFWRKRIDLVRNTTLKAVYDRFSDTGRFAAFRCDWKEGMPNKPHYFWDSDVAKWIEGAAYLLQEKRDPELEAIVDGIVDNIEKNQWEDGYFNIYYMLFAKDRRFTRRDEHELYCAGHLMEAAVAYAEATGKKKFLDCMVKYAAYIEKRFKTDCDTGFVTPGHEEIELALAKLYGFTGDERWLELSRFFIDKRGTSDEQRPDWMKPEYNQSHLPVREQRTAEGHSVRACYLYSGMADIARLTEDGELKEACKAIFDDITRKKMYVTGGIGSSSGGEAFTVPYDLPNIISYTETCAAIALGMFAGRMQLIEADSKYADTLERIIYNGFLSSLSLDGRSFFYENPLEILPCMHTRDVSIKNPAIHLPPMRRSEVFGCSCCPPNIVRFIPSISDYFYTVDNSGNLPLIYMHQFAESTAKIPAGKGSVTIKQKTKFPENGKLAVTVKGGKAMLAVRIPSWSDGFKVTDLSGAIFVRKEKGYAFFNVSDGAEIKLDLGMRIRLVEADPYARFDCGRVAVTRGPVVYCLEGCDNGEPLRDIKIKAKSLRYKDDGPVRDVPSIVCEATRRYADSFKNELYKEAGTAATLDFEAVFIPYYAMANRKETEMQVWTLAEASGKRLG
ncbi:MAG: glycoside hydrolase family 127 protein [Clostridia bacterium]|nr:glycoside hydrolase family 127 protein [Clostridia bacterium]